MRGRFVGRLADPLFPFSTLFLQSPSAHMLQRCALTAAVARAAAPFVPGAESPAAGT